jgi:tripartite-type tricarboxylate transporter receptor subunit TctC
MIVFVAVVFLVGIGLATHGSWAAAGKYPSRTIQVIICFAPGSTDLTLRPFADKLPEYLNGQSLSFIYKPGGAGATGASFAAKARPDGYTLLYTSPSPVLINPITKDDLDYSLEDFLPICRLVKSGAAVIAVKADSPFKTIQDIIAAAKKSPGKLTYSTTGVYSTLHVPMEMFCQSAGIKLTHVPCAGTAPAVAALLGGHVDMTSASMASIISHLKSGTLRAVAVHENEKLKDFPNVPNLAELGYYSRFFNWYGFMAPKGTSPEVVETIYTACKKVVDDHRNFIESRLENISCRLAFLGPEDYGRVIKDEYAAMKKIYSELTKAGKP